MIEKKEIPKDRHSLRKCALEKENKPIDKDLIIDEENRF